MIVFSEAIKVKDGILYNLKYHQERINKTLKDFYRTEIDLSVINDMIPNHVKSGLYKCRVLYSGKIEKVEFIPYAFRYVRTVAVITDNEISYSYKYADRNCINTLLQKSGCDDILIIKNGLVTDASSSNLVFRSREGLFTPKDYLLPGTKRKLLLDHKKIEERSIPVNEIKAFDTVYFINAMVDLEDNIKVETCQLHIPSLSGY
jgi:4-amino-4-deoxychorismate lyase